MSFFKQGIVVYNFIWMGNLSTENYKFCCALGPKSLAQFKPNETVTLWVPESLMGDAKELFKEYSNIDIKSVDKWLRGEYGQLMHIGEQANNILNVLATMEKTASYASQKDLLSFAIIAEFGGYYFDCTTQFTKEPHFPLITDFKVAFQKKYLSKAGEYFEIGTPIWYHLEVWIFAACTHGNRLFIDTTNRILEKFQEYYPLEDDWIKEPWLDIGPCSFENILRENYDKSSLKKILFGDANYNLRTSHTWFRDFNQWVKEHIWGLAPSESGSGDVLESIGVEKFNTGLWRGREGSKYGLMDWNTKARKKLGLFEFDTNDSQHEIKELGCKLDAC